MYAPEEFFFFFLRLNEKLRIGIQTERGEFYVRKAWKSKLKYKQACFYHIPLLSVFQKYLLSFTGPAFAEHKM